MSGTCDPLAFRGALQHQSVCPWLWALVSVAAESAWDLKSGFLLSSPDCNTAQRQQVATSNVRFVLFLQPFRCEGLCYLKQTSFLLQDPLSFSIFTMRHDVTNIYTLSP